MSDQDDNPNEGHRTHDDAKLRWLLAGQYLLRSGGILAVKLDALSTQAGLTTGSFYHHFKNMDAYLGALAGFYGSEQVDTHLAGLLALSPQARLTELTTLSLDQRMHPLGAAMRAWGSSDKAAGQAVRDADAALLSFIKVAFEEIGFTTQEAQLRATVLLSVGVAQIQPPWPLPRGTRHLVLELLLGTEFDDTPAPKAQP